MTSQRRLALPGLGKAPIVLAVPFAAVRLKATCYTRRAPVSDFALDQARVVDLREHSELKPLIKTTGVGMPGLVAGRIWLLGLVHPQAVLEILRRSQG